MQTVKTNQGEIEVWENPKELPIDRFSDMQKYSIQDIGIGSTLADVDRHHFTLDALLSQNRNDEARVERYNMHYNFYLILNKVDITSLTFCCFIRSINGEKIADYSETYLVKNVIPLLAKIELGRGQMEEILETVKKKLLPNWNYFSQKTLEVGM